MCAEQSLCPSTVVRFGGVIWVSVRRAALIVPMVVRVGVMLTTGTESLSRFGSEESSVAGRKGCEFVSSSRTQYASSECSEGAMDVVKFLWKPLV